MFQKIVKALGGDPNKRDLDRMSSTVKQINALEAEYERLSDDALAAKTMEFKQRIAEQVEGITDEQARRQAEQDALNDLLVEAFAVVREAAKRTLGKRPFDVQLIGGIVLHEGKIAEMRTGEGKTLLATLPMYLNALLGRGTHLVTVNDYLARRDARWNAPVYNLLGMSVGVLQMAARTENGRNAFLVDLSKESVHEDQHQLKLVLRHEAYDADITYGTNSEFGFDYLRDNLTKRLEDRVQRKHYYAIVDEVDNILIDEARTPLIISGPSSDNSESFVKMSQVVRQLRSEDYEINEKDRSVTLTELGDAHVEELLGVPLRDPDRPEDITPEQARMLGYLEQALRAQFLFRRNKDYLVQAGKVVIVDEFTGRLMPGRRWSDGLHQAVEAKEGVKVEAENVTYATITIQNYFRMYQKLAGMSGTATTESEEFWKIYKLDVLPIPTNLEYRAAQQQADLVTQEAKDEQGYKYTYYARRDDPRKAPLFWRRKDYPDMVYRTEEAKLRAITQEIIQLHVIGRPQLVGTTSVEHSERLSSRLAAEPVRKLALALALRDLYIQQNNIQLTERAIADLQPLNVPLDSLDIGDMRKLARSLDLAMSFNPEDPDNVDRLIAVLKIPGEKRDRVIKALQVGVPHQVLNARKHDEESKIIARAGAFGAVTIATNMAGRGVDIKLGGEIDEETLGDVNRILDRAGFDGYNMTNDQRREALQKLSAEDFGIYQQSVADFFTYMSEMEQVRELGGLHVLGSERHEARRIDNQLRGRAARQGDPGSSRFYLAMDDELMRLFGGKQVEGLMARLNIDESMPIESGIVGRLVEQSQERVEGANFDMRKHLLEYDDVLNSQRHRIYEQRDRIFVKPDLSEDLDDMLRIELQQRIPEALKDEEGPWKLVDFLEQIQPPIVFEDLRYPSFAMRLLINDLLKKRPSQGATSAHLRDALLSVAQRTLDIEQEHLVRSFQQLLERTEENLESQRQERFDMLDTYIDQLDERSEDEGPLRLQDASEQVGALVRLPNFRLTPEQFRLLQENTPALRDSLRRQIESYLQALAVGRISGAIERRLGEGMNLRAGQLQDMDWDEVQDLLGQEMENLLKRQRERLLGERTDGQIARDLDAALVRIDGFPTEENALLDFLGLMAEGTRTVFDQKTHRRGIQRTTRMNYAFLAGKLLGDESQVDIVEDVLDHLKGAQEVLSVGWGRFEWNRRAQLEAPIGAQLSPGALDQLQQRVGAERLEEIKQLPLSALDETEAAHLREVFGWSAQNELTRQLLLSVISDMWVDYLTRVEALRVSIGLEAYAQRNPLVEYKSRASEMFQQLLADIRMGVVSRVFTFRPRAQPPTAPEARAAVQEQPAAPAAVVNASAGERPSGGKKKRKRH